MDVHSCTEFQTELDLDPHGNAKRDPLHELALLATGLDEAQAAAIAAVDAGIAQLRNASNRYCDLSRAIEHRLHTDDLYKEIADSHVTALVKAAEAELSEPGMPVRFDADSIRREHEEYIQKKRQKRTYGIEFYRIFNASVALRFIRANFNPTALRRSLVGSAARALSDYLGMTRGQAPATVGGKIVFEIRIYGSRGFSGGCLKLSHDAMSRLTQALNIATTQEAPYPWRNLAQSISATFAKLAWDGYVSRDRFNLTDGAHLVAYTETAKLHVPVAFAEAINLFVSEHRDSGDEE